MPVLCWSILILRFCLLSAYSRLIHLWHIHTAYLLYLYSFAIEVFAEGQHSSLSWSSGPCGVSSRDTSFCVCVIPKLLINSLASPFLLFFLIFLCLNSQSQFLCCNLVPFYLFLNFSYNGHHMLLSSSLWLILLSMWCSSVHFYGYKWIAIQLHNFRASFSLLNDSPLSISTRSFLSFNLSVDILLGLCLGSWK